MHIHGSSMHIHAAGFNSANLQSRAALEAQRAAETRKRLLKKSESLEAESDPDAVLLIGHWLNPNSGQPQNDDEYREPSESVERDLY